MWNAVIVDRDYGSVSLETRSISKKSMQKRNIPAIGPLHHAG